MPGRLDHLPVYFPHAGWGQVRMVHAGMVRVSYAHYAVSGEHTGALGWPAGLNLDCGPGGASAGLRQ